MEKTMEMKSTDDGRRLDAEIEKACASVSRTDGAQRFFLADMARISAEFGPEATLAAVRAHVLSITAGGNPAWSDAQLDRLRGALQSLIDTASARRRIKLAPEEAEMFEKVMRTENQVFREKFGREMGPDDPLFFDHDADTPQPMSKEGIRQMLVDGAEDAGFPPRSIYAIRKTGLVMDEHNRDRFSEEQRRAWDDAVAEYDTFQ